MKIKKEEIETRRKKVKELYDEGKSQKEISDLLHISEATISKYIKMIREEIERKRNDNKKIM